MELFSKIVVHYFCENLELNLEILSQRNHFLVAAIGNFNAKSKTSYFSDKTKGKVLKKITSQFGLQQIIKEPTHILDNSSFCIDLIFRSQPNLRTESSFQQPLHPNSHHQVVYTKFNLQIYYLTQYYREVWHYKYANIKFIIKAIDGFN